MAIEFKCEKCGRKLSVPETAVGRSLQCPNVLCGWRLTVPARSEVPAEVAVGAGDIAFDCPFCQNQLVVQKEGVGMELPCPKCGGRVTVPEGKAPQAAADDATVEDKFLAFDCTKCGVEIEAPRELAGGRIDCPKCGAMLDIPASEGGETGVSVDPGGRKRRMALISAVLAGVVVVGGSVICWPGVRGRIGEIAGSGADPGVRGSAGELRSAAEAPAGGDRHDAGFVLVPRPAGGLVYRTCWNEAEAIQVRYPETWKPSAEVPEGTIAEFVGPAGDQPGGLPSKVVISKAGLSAEASTPDQIGAAWVNQLKGQFKRVAVEEAAADLSGRPGKRIVVRAEGDPATVMVLRVFVHEATAYMMTYTGVAAHYAKDERILDEMAESFSVDF